MNYLFLAAYAIILVFLGFFSARRGGLLSYLIADRDVGPVGIGFSVAAGFFDGFVLVSYTGFVYMYGWPAVSLFVGIVLGFMLFYLFSVKLQKEARENKYYGMSDFFKNRYGKGSEMVVSIFNVMFYVALLLIQFLFGSAILQEISGLPYVICLFVVAAMLLSYIAVGGFRAVLTTDIFQWILIILIVIFFTPYFLTSDVTKAALSHADFSNSAGEAIGFLIIGCMGVFSAPELWQRCFAARDEKSIRRGLLIAGGMLPLVGAILASIGFAAFGNFPGLNPEDALVKVFREMLPPALEGLGLLLLLSAILSSADTALFVLAPTVALNIFGITDDKKAKDVTRITIVAAVIIAVFTGIFIRDVLSIAFSLAGLSLGLFPILFGGLIWKLNPRVVTTSLVMGMASVAVLILSGQIRPETSVISLPVVFLSLLIGSVWVRWKDTGGSNKKPV